MAPRIPKKVVSVTKKEKVVEETLKVTVTDGDPNVTTETQTQDEETQDLTFSIPVEENVTTVEIPVDVRDDHPSPQAPETPAHTSQGTVKETHKVEKKHGKKKMTKRGDLARDEYKRYVYKVMKQVHPELGITSKAMSVINMFMGDMFERIAEEAARLSDYTKRRTLSSRLVLPGELSRHAVSEGSKAISNYVAYDTCKS